MKKEYKDIGSEYSAIKIINIAKEHHYFLGMALEMWDKIKDKKFSKRHKELLINIEEYLS